MPSPLHAIVRAFTGEAAIQAITPLGNGLINQTFKIDCAEQCFVLQAINRQVFPQPELLMANFQQLHLHLQNREVLKLQIPKLLPTNAGQLFFTDADGQPWRAMQLIHPAESREQLSNHEEAAAVGQALAQFHLLFSDLPSHLLHDTLPGFHITPGYYAAYRRQLSDKPQPFQNAETLFCRNFIEAFSDQIAVLELAKAQGLLQQRIIHGDPKLNNFLFAPGNNQIIGMVDLDTVKPGLIHYDIGDCLRSCCHLKDGDLFDLEICNQILSHYLAVTGVFFKPADYEYLYAAIKLIPFELGLRFFSDYLAGNRYFKVKYSQQNLHRAVAQFQLCQSIIDQQQELRDLIHDLSGSYR